jgi:uncharacterized protein (UPF0548 family)
VNGPIHLGRPTAAERAALLDEQRVRPFSYHPVGISSADSSAAGYTFDGATAIVGDGRGTYKRAIECLRTWDVHRAAGMQITASGPVAPEATVVMSLPVGILHVTAACRVIDVVGSERAWEFAYGTLEHHVESGEERFRVVLDREDRVRFEISAFARPAHLLTRVGAPFTRRLQHRATLRYLHALQTLVDASAAP